MLNNLATMPCNNQIDFGYRPFSQTVFMLSIAINRAEHLCATVIIKHNYMSCFLLVLLYINVYYIIMFAPLYNVYQYYYIIMYRICKCIQCFYYLLYRFIYQAGVALNISYLNTVVICVIMSSGLSIKLTLFHDGTT